MNSPVVTTPLSTYPLPNRSTQAVTPGLQKGKSSSDFAKALGKGRAGCQEACAKSQDFFVRQRPLMGLATQTGLLEIIGMPGLGCWFQVSP